MSITRLTDYLDPMGSTFEQVAERTALAKGLFPCAAQTVTAILVTKGGKQYYGSNGCMVAQDVCPRRTLGLPSGVGYYRCDWNCAQPYHAETSAMMECIKSDDTPVGGTMYVYNHVCCCEDCQDAMKLNGIKRAIVVDNGKEYIF